MKTIIVVALAFMTFGCVRYVCDNDKRERLIMECLDRTSAKVVNAGEDVELGNAVWPCRSMADSLSCWEEKDKWPWQ